MKWFKFISKKRLLLLITPILIIYSSLLIIEPRGAHDFPYVYPNSYSNISLLPYAWSSDASGIGGSVVSLLSNWPTSLIFNVALFFNIDFLIIQRLVILISLVLGFIGVKKILNSLGIYSLPEYVGEIFYLTNSFILLLIDGGQLSVVLAYSIFPLVYYFICKGLEGGFRDKFLASFMVSVMGFFDLRFIYIVGILFIVKFFFYIKNRGWVVSIKEYINLGLISTVVFLSLHSFWIIPLIIVKESPLPKSYTQLQQTSFLNFTSLGHSLLIQQPHWPENNFGNINHPNVWFLMIPFTAFFVVILKKRGFDIAYWLLVATIGVFLAKGIANPGGEIYQWLFSNLPGFYFFRDSTKFFFLTTLAYSILMAYTANYLERYKLIFKNYAINFQISKIRHNNTSYSFGISTFFILYFVLLTSPIFLNKTSGIFSRPVKFDSYKQVATQLNQDKEFGRIIWIPKKGSFGYGSLDHPGFDALTLTQKRAFAVGIKGDYEVLNYLREYPITGELLNILSVKYLAYPDPNNGKNKLSQDDIKYYSTFSSQIADLSWIKKLSNNPYDIALFETEKHQDKLFVAENIFWVVGSDDLYIKTDTSSGINLDNNGLIFLDQHPGLGARIKEIPSPKVILNKKTSLDLAASFIPAEYFLFPAKQLNYDPNHTGWWKRDSADLIGWQNFLMTKYQIKNQDFDFGGGWAVAEGQKELLITNNKIDSDTILLARVLESTKSGEISFYQGDKLISQQDTFKPGNGISWREVGVLGNNLPLKIHTQGEINVINALVFLPNKMWQEYKSQAEVLAKSTDTANVDLSNAKRHVEVEFNKVNPTRYVLKVKNITTPILAIISESYHDQWRMNNQKPLPVYDLLNGFTIDKDGEYQIEFLPQRYVWQGLGVSIISLVIISIVLFRRFK